MSYAERESDARLAAMQARAEAAEARLAQIAELLEKPVCESVRFSRADLLRASSLALRLARGGEPV